MCTSRHASVSGRFNALMDACGLKLDVALMLALAGLAAATLSASLVTGLDHAAVATSSASACLLALAAHCVANAREERSEADYWRGQAESYGRMLNDYFLVSKVDANGRFCEANENLLRRTGYSLEELAGQPLGGLSSGDLSDDYLSCMWSTVQSGQTWSGEFCDRSKDGSRIWIRAIVIPWKNARGVIECMTTIGVDVTEQRNAEMELKQAHARLQAFIKHAPAAVAMIRTCGMWRIRTAGCRIITSIRAR